MHGVQANMEIAAERDQLLAVRLPQARRMLNLTEQTISEDGQSVQCSTWVCSHTMESEAPDYCLLSALPSSLNPRHATPILSRPTTLVCSVPR